MKKFLLLSLLYLLLCPAVFAQKKSPMLSQHMVDSFIKRYPDSLGLEQNKVARWGYEQGLMLKAIERVWERTGERKYLDYIVRIMDYSIGDDGSIQRYKYEDFNLDNINTGTPQPYTVPAKNDLF